MSQKMATECRDKALQSMAYIESLNADKFDFIKDLLVSYIRIADLHEQNYSRVCDELCLLKRDLELARAREDVIRNMARVPGRLRDQ